MRNPIKKGLKQQSRKAVAKQRIRKPLETEPLNIEEVNLSPTKHGIRNVVRQALATGLSRTLSDRATTRARHFDKGANPKETACASNAVLGIVPGVAISIV